MATQAHKEFDAWYRGVWPEESMNVKGHLLKNQMCAAWLASREAIIVTLPEIDPFETEANLHIDDCADRIKAVGLTVAYDKEETKMKYIVTKDENGKEEIFIFPKQYHHDDFADTVCGLKTFINNDPFNWERLYKQPIAAGFTDGKQCFGRSETLNLDSRGRLDEMLIDGNG